jgi:EmrB/QacA subfamily drug resistance transporter
MSNSTVRAESDGGAQPLSQSSSTRAWVFVAAMATIFMAAVEGTIVATAMPTIVGELGGFELFSWVFTAYLLTQAITIPIYGRLADFYGRKRMLLTGIGIFFAGSVLCGFAWNMETLIAFRVAQGIGTGALIPVAMTIVGDLYTPAERARMQGYLSSIWSIAAITGPMLGAFLVAHTTWSWVFWVNAPIAVAAATLLVVGLKEHVQPRAHRMNYLGVALLGLGIGTFMFALIQASTLTAGTMTALIAAAAAILAVLVVHERKAPEPILPLRLWRHPIVAASAVSSFCVGAIIMGGSVFLSLYVQNVMGRNALVAGLVLTAMSASWMFGSIGGGRLMLWTSYRATVWAGGLWLLPGATLLILLDPTRGPAWAAVGAFLMGVGLGFANNTYTVAVQASVDYSQRGVATSSTVFMRIIGQSVGTALYGGILNAGVIAGVPGGGDIVHRLMDPALRQSLPPSTIAPLVAAMASALHNVYVIQAVVVLVMLTTAICLPAGLSPLKKAHAER